MRMRTRAAALLGAAVAASLAGGFRASARVRGDAPAPEQASLFHQSLAELGLSPGDLRIAQVDFNRLTNRAPAGAVQAFLMDEPLQTRWFMQHVREELLADLAGASDVQLASPIWEGLATPFPTTQKWNGSGAGLADTIGKLSRWGDRVVRRTLLGNPIAADLERAAGASALVDSIAALSRRTGRPLDETQQREIGQAVARAPVAMRRAGALVLGVAERVVAARDVAIRRLDRTPLIDAGALHEQLSLDGERLAEGRDRLEQFEIGGLLAASQELAIACHVAAHLLLHAPVEPCDVRIETPLGVVRLSGGGANQYGDEQPYLLILDHDGDDEYAAGAGATGLMNPVSVVIDVRGDDRYVTRSPPASATASSPVPATSPASRPASTQPVPPQAPPCAFGAGILGVGMLIDCSGDDVYEAAQCGMAYALFGVGMLDDWDGNDRYRCVAEGQASAAAGLALLVDRAGDDAYDAYTVAQAFAGVAGMGALIDLSGSDAYTANDSDIRFPSAQSPQHNSSLCQGAAAGHRADYLDGYSVAGGIAILLDAAGNDAYSCGVFGQGTGYWMGCGFLIDAGGDDRYTGQWYVQGSAAHFALGALLDEAGNDNYAALMATSQGTGHDLSVGFLADLAGDDAYQSGGLTMGAGNEGGIGICFDCRGDDRYEVLPDTTLGYVNAPQGIRASMPTFGLFVDAAGNDRYSQPYAGNGRRWGVGPARGFTALAKPRHALGLDAELPDADLIALWRRAPQR